MIDKIGELVPKLAHQLGVPVQELFYHWMSPRRSEMEQVGIIKNNKLKYFLKNTKWRYFFHGIDCDLWNTKDGRFLNVCFGPKGRIDTFEQGGVSRFVFTSKSPWPEYVKLKQFLFGQKFHELLKRNETEPKFRGLPIIPFPNWAKMELLMDELEAYKFIERPDPELWQLVKKYTKKLSSQEFKERFGTEQWQAARKTTTIDDEGASIIDLPETTTEKEWIDTCVCHRWVISAKGTDQIKR